MTNTTIYMRRIHKHNKAHRSKSGRCSLIRSTKSGELKPKPRVSDPAITGAKTKNKIGYTAGDEMKDHQTGLTRSSEDLDRSLKSASGNRFWAQVASWSWNDALDTQGRSQVGLGGPEREGGGGELKSDATESSSSSNDSSGGDDAGL